VRERKGGVLKIPFPNALPRSAPPTDGEMPSENAVEIEPTSAGMK
jgi:hypothetical protein